VRDERREERRWEGGKAPHTTALYAIRVSYCIDTVAKLSDGMCGLPQHTRTAPTRAKRDNGCSKHQAAVEKSEIPAAYMLDTHAQKGG